MSEWLDEAHEAEKSLQSVVSCLCELGYCLSVVGMQKLCNDIHKVAAKVSSANSKLREAVNSAVIELHEQSREATVNMANTALAVVQAQDPGEPVLPELTSAADTDDG